jgi:hypothetical protein
MSFFDDSVEDDPAPDTPLDETTPPMDLLEKAADKDEAVTPEDRGGDDGEPS